MKWFFFRYLNSSIKILWKKNSNYYPKYLNIYLRKYLSKYIHLFEYLKRLQLKIISSVDLILRPMSYENKPGIHRIIATSASSIYILYSIKKLYVKLFGFVIISVFFLSSLLFTLNFLTNPFSRFAV